MTELVSSNNPSATLGHQQNKQGNAANDCRNCGTPLTGPFCHQCGQPSKSIIRFFGSLIQELLEDVISLDSRAFRTLLALLFRPGFLTLEYVKGRRFSYVPPLRLFLLCSLFCIFVLWVMNLTSENEIVNVEQSKVSEKVKEEIGKHSLAAKISQQDFDELSPEEQQKVIANINEANKVLESMGLPTTEIPESIKNSLKKQEKQVEITDKDAKKITEQGKSEDNQNNKQEGIQIQSGKITTNIPGLSDEQNKALAEKLEKKFKKVKEDPKDFIGDLLEMIPKSMLLLVPFFALLMKISYPFAKRYYIEHLIHAFHGHAFLFLAIVISILLELVSDSMSTSSNTFVQILGSIFGIAEIVLLCWIPIYFFISLKKVYQQHWLLTFWKWMWLGMLYIILFSSAAVVVLILGALIG